MKNQKNERINELFGFFRMILAHPNIISFKSAYVNDATSVNILTENIERSILKEIKERRINLTYFYED